MGAGGMGCGGLLLVLLISYLTGVNPLQLLGMMQSSQVAQGPSTVQTGDQPEDQLGQFASVVLADTEETWTNIFREEGQSYQLPRMVLFSDAVQSACGFTSAAVGPFYCPADQAVYLDLGFFRTLDQRFDAPGDFAQAYVIAHEVGHHVQNLLGISSEVQSARQRMSRSQANQMSVRLELQADCLAGVWANRAHNQRQLLDPGDVEEGLRAASAIGDDAMQKRSTGYVQPESWTHGSAEQRTYWLRRGLESGDPDQCDTFADTRM